MTKNSKQELRTPLKRVLGLGSAHSGTKNYRSQLLTSLLNIPLFIIFAFLMIVLLHKDYEEARAMIENPFIAMLFVLMLLSGICHMHFGMRVILEDYIASHHLRVLGLALNFAFCFALGAFSILAVLKIAVGE